MSVAAARSARRHAVEVVHTLDRKRDIELTLDEGERTATILDRAQGDQTAVVDRRLRYRRGTLKLYSHSRSLMPYSSLYTPSPPVRLYKNEDAIVSPG